MLSGFLKRLLFARQFTMDDGRITVLGEKEIMLPVEIVTSLGEDGYDYKSIKKLSKDKLKVLAEKIGAKREGIVKSVEEIFDTYGLGKLRIIDLDNKKKSCIVMVNQSPLVKECLKSKNRDEGCVLIRAVLAGFFSYLFDKEVDCKNLKCSPSLEGNCEFAIK